VVERSPRSHGQRLELVEIPLPRGLFCHCTDKAGYIYSALLYNSVSLFSCCGSFAALDLANCNEYVAEANVS
jgi:hypothetical protein